MKDISSKQFGLVVAYLLPGFIGLFGIAPFVPAVSEWLRPMSRGDLGIGPTVYAILAAIAIGMIISCFRWLLIDHLCHWTGIHRPMWDDRHLEGRLGAFDYLVEVHYRYYQFYSNTIVALAFVYCLNRFLNVSPHLGFGTDLGVAFLCVVLFVGSRNALSNYYAIAHGKVTFVLSITDSNETSYSLRVAKPNRSVSLRAQTTKAFRLHVVLPGSLASGSIYVLTGSCNVLSGFTDPDPGNNTVDFSGAPITISGDQSNGNVGYFTFSPFRATQESGNVKFHISGELGTVTAFPGGSVEYNYQQEYGIGTLQIASTSSDQFALFQLSIYHHAPFRLNGKTITIVPSSKGASGSGSLIEEGFAVPGLTYTTQVAYYKLT